MHRRECVKKRDEIVGYLIAVNSVFAGELSQRFRVSARARDVLAGLHIAVFDEVCQSGNDVLLHGGHLFLVRDELRLNILLDEVVIVDVADASADRNGDICDIDLEYRHRKHSGYEHNEHHADGQSVSVAESLANDNHAYEQVGQTCEIEYSVDEEKLSAVIAVRVEVKHPSERRGNGFHKQINGKEYDGGFSLIV